MPNPALGRHRARPCVGTLCSCLRQAVGPRAWTVPNPALGRRCARHLMRWHAVFLPSPGRRAPGLNDAEPCFGPASRTAMRWHVMFLPSPGRRASGLDGTEPGAERDISCRQHGESPPLAWDVGPLLGMWAPWLGWCPPLIATGLSPLSVSSGKRAGCGRLVRSCHHAPKGGLHPRSVCE